MKRAGALALLLLALAAPARADMDAAVASFNRGEYAAAVDEFRALAERGNAAAQYMLGFLYAEGQGVKQDLAESLKWHSRASAQGYVGTPDGLLIMYSDRRGPPATDAGAVAGPSPMEEGQAGRDGLASGLINR